MAKFVAVFPRVALALSIVGAIVTTGPLVVFLLVAQDEIRAVEVPGQSALSRFVVQHLIGFALFWWLFCIVAIAASLALLRRKQWAVRVWLALLAILVLWSLTVISSETLNVAMSAVGASPGHFPSNPVMAAAAAIPAALLFGALAGLLFFRLMAHRQEFASPRTRGEPLT